MRIRHGDFPDPARRGQFSPESSDDDDSDESCDEATSSALKDDKKVIESFMQSNASSLAKFYASADPKEEKLPTKAEELQPCYLSKAGSTSESQQQSNNSIDDSSESAPTFISECVPAVRPPLARKDDQVTEDSQIAKDTPEGLQTDTRVREQQAGPKDSALQ